MVVTFSTEKFLELKYHLNNHLKSNAGFISSSHVLCYFCLTISFELMNSLWFSINIFLSQFRHIQRPNHNRPWSTSVDPKKSCHFILWQNRPRIEKSTCEKKTTSFSTTAWRSGKTNNDRETETEFVRTWEMWFPHFDWNRVSVLSLSLHECFRASWSRYCVAGVSENWWTNICLYLLLTILLLEFSFRFHISIS